MTKEERAEMMAFRARNPNVPVLRNLNAKILAAVTDKRGRANGELCMSYWHCGTSHCIAGWAVELAGKKGGALQDRRGTADAGYAIFVASTGTAPDFYCSDGEALRDLRKRVRKSLKVTK